MKKRVRNVFSRKAQIWVETVIYTLIAFIMIGIVLAFAKPKIEEFQDKTIVEDSVKMMEGIENIITEIDRRGAGNQRTIKLEMKKGMLKIVGFDDEMEFVIDSRYKYSEEGADFQEGNIVINTKGKGGLNTITMTRYYSSKYDLTYKGDANGLKTINPSATAYNLIILNKGNIADKTIIDFEIK